MYSLTLAAIVLAGAVNAASPPGFQPSSDSDLVVAFGNTLAVDGVNLQKAIAQTAPTVGTTDQLFGTYALIMVDPDIPPANPGGPTGQLLHWMQTGLQSANTRSTVAGREVFELATPTNTTAVASYRGPNPPARSPTTHRYIQMLVNTTNNEAAVSALSAAGATRLPFSAEQVVSSAGLTVLAANWFTVSNNSVVGGGPGASGGNGSPVATGTGASPTETGAPFTGGASLLGSSVAMIGLGMVMVLVL